MTWFDHCRRAVSILLVALCLLAVPAVAEARFTASKPATLSVGTDKMEMPTAVSGTYRCGVGFFTESFDVSVTGFTDAGPAGAKYEYSLTRATTEVKNISSASRSASLGSGNLLIDGSSTRWTLAITSTLGSWTGPAYTKTITCPALSSATGTL